jgi:hypothetical protein
MDMSTGMSTGMSNPTEPTDYFRLYGVPRDAAFPEAIECLSRHVLTAHTTERRPRLVYARAVRADALHVLTALPNPATPFLEELCRVLFAVWAKGKDADWQARWWCDKLTRWMLAVRCVDPTTGRREPE